MRAVVTQAEENLAGGFRATLHIQSACMLWRSLLVLQTGVWLESVYSRFRLLYRKTHIATSAMADLLILICQIQKRKTSVSDTYQTSSPPEGVVTMIVLFLPLSLFRLHNPIINIPSYCLAVCHISVMQHVSLKRCVNHYCLKFLCC